MTTLPAFTIGDRVRLIGLKDKTGTIEAIWGEKALISMYRGQRDLLTRWPLKELRHI